MPVSYELLEDIFNQLNDLPFTIDSAFRVVGFIMIGKVFKSEKRGEKKKYT